VDAISSESLLNSDQLNSQRGNSGQDVPIYLDASNCTLRGKPVSSNTEIFGADGTSFDPWVLAASFQKKGLHYPCGL